MGFLAALDLQQITGDGSSRLAHSAEFPYFFQSEIRLSYRGKPISLASKAGIQDE